MIGPLPFVPDCGGVVVYAGDTDERAFERAARAEFRRIQWQCQAERNRVLDAVGWWDLPPPKPPILDARFEDFYSAAAAGTAGR